METASPPKPTSEERYGIVAQPEPTCPTVDAVLVSIKDAESRLKRWDRMDLDELRSAADYTEWYLDRARESLEEVREANQRLRAWGEEWKQKAKELGSA
jgi:hypothetical protein